MKRLWIFILVGPFVGFIASLILGQATSMMTGEFFIMMLPVAYLFGLVPALLTCLIDHVLADRFGDFKRAAATALAGYVSVVATLAAYQEKMSWELALVGFAGAIAGFVCSLASVDKQRGRTQ